MRPINLFIASITAAISGRLAAPSPDATAGPPTRRVTRGVCRCTAIRKVTIDSRAPRSRFISTPAHYSKGELCLAAIPTSTISSAAVERADPRKREAVLHRIQQLTIDRAMFAPITDLRALMGVGPRVTEHTITWIHNSPFPSYEDMRLKSRRFFALSG